MIHIFNRKELLTTFKMDEQARVRNILASNKVDYTVKTGNRTSPSSVMTGSRSRAGTFGIRTDAVCAYTIYVKSTDYEKALFLIKE